MKVLGISGSPCRGSTTDQLVQEVLEGACCEADFISLAGKRIGPCIACLGCVDDNVCVLEDDMQPLRSRIVEADAYVIGAPNYFGALNGLAHCFLERWYQFRHQAGKAVTGKLGVAVGIGGGAPETPAKDIERFFQYNQIECVGSVTAQGPAACFTCRHGETCAVSAIRMFFGAGTKITPEVTPHLSKQPEARDKARALGETLARRLADRAT